MLRNAKTRGLLVLAPGGLLGWGVATGKLAGLLGGAEEKPAAPGNGVQVTGEPGSPSATTTTPGNQLPPPPKFGGKIEDTAQKSRPLTGHHASCRPSGRPTFCSS
jgi:hypothetical protein